MKIHQYNQMMAYLTRPSQRETSVERMGMMAGGIPSLKFMIDFILKFGPEVSKVGGKISREFLEFMGEKNPQNILNVYEDVRKKLQKIGDKKQKLKLPKEGDVKIGEAPKTDIKKVKQKVEADKKITQELADENQIPVKDQTGPKTKTIKTILNADQLRALGKKEGIPEEDVEKFLSGELGLLKRGQARGMVQRDKEGNIVIKDKYSKKYDPLRKNPVFTDQTDLKKDLENITDSEISKSYKEALEGNDLDLSDNKYDAQILADYVAYNRYRTDFYDLPQDVQLDLYDKSYQWLMNDKMEKAQQYKNIKIFDDKEASALTKFMKEQDPEGFKNIERIVDDINNKNNTDAVDLEDFDVTGRKPNAEGGLIGGGMIEGEDLGSRTGFSDPDPVKLQKLKQLVDEANQSLEIPPRKIILYQKAGYKGTKAKSKSEAKKILDTLIPSEKKVELAWDNFLNSSEDTLISDMKNPITKISEQTKMSVSKVSKILNKYDNYVNNKDIVNKLKSVEFFKRTSGRDYTYGDLLDEISNRSVRSGILGSTAEDKILNYALSHWEKNKGTGKSKVKFLNDPYSEDVRDWKFKYEGKTYTGDDIMRKGRTFKAFKEVYDLQDKIDSLKTETIDFNGETITKEEFFKRAYAKGTGKNYFYGRTPFDQDHIEGIKKDPFKNLRILPARINQGAGSIKQNADKFGNVENALNKIGYNYEKSFEQLIEDETKLANDIFTKGRKLRSPYEIAAQTKSTEYIRPKRSKVPLSPEFDLQTGKLKPVKPGEGFAKVSNLTQKQPLKNITDDITLDVIRGKELSANPFMKMLRVGAPTLPAIFGPTGVAGLTYAFRPEGGYDLSRPEDRITFGLEAALAPTTVKGTSKAASYLAGGNQPLRRGLERLINLGMRAPTALKVARIASPIGIISLLGEGGYQFGKALQEEKARIAAMSPEERQRFEEEQTAAAYMGEAENFAYGGRVQMQTGGDPKDKKKTTPALDKPTIPIDPNAPTDPGRRDFMEKGVGFGALGGAIATGLIKFAPEIKKAITSVTTQIDQMPDIIGELYFTIRNRGKITNYGGNENPVTTELGPYKLEEGPGGFSITKTTDSDYRYQQEYFEVQTDPEKGAIGYEELTVRPDMDGKLKDVDYGVDLDTYREIGEYLAKIRKDDKFIKIADDDIAKQIEKEQAFKEALQKKGKGEND